MVERKEPTTGSGSNWTLERSRERHQPVEWRDGVNNYEGPDQTLCRSNGVVDFGWPCEASKLLEHIEKQQKVIEAAREAMRCARGRVLQPVDAHDLRTALAALEGKP